MTTAQLTAYRKIADELSVMSTRLDQLSCDAYVDAEHAQGIAADICNTIYGMEAVVLELQPRIQRLREMLK